ncbi:MAG TPA: HAMP domain-containing sensor histidine kinase, partial [Chloroflexota bacterium]
ALTEVERGAMTNVAQLVGLALEQARLYEVERRARRDLEQAQEQGQAFLRIVAHDLKTPLTNILGYAQLAQRLRGRLMALWHGTPNDVDDRLRVGLDKIVDNCRRLHRLVDELQEAFRLGSGRFELQRAPLDLTALVRQIVDEQRAVAPYHQFDPSLPPQSLVGTWDAERLRQIIANLLSNAVKYSPEGGPITVTLRRYDDTAALTVADKGLGIPAADLPSLFQPYSRLHQSRQIKGTGLGLYIVKGIVEAHGGSVSAASPGEGAGATFTVTLPLTPRSASAASPDTHVSTASRPDTPPTAELPSSPVSL